MWTVLIGRLIDGLVSAVMQMLYISRTFGLPVYQCSNPNIWSQALGTDEKNKITNKWVKWVSSIGWLSFRGRVRRSSDIQNGVRAKLLLLSVEKSQLRCFGDLNTFDWPFSEHVQLRGDSGDQCIKSRSIALAAAPKSNLLNKVKITNAASISVLIVTLVKGSGISPVLYVSLSNIW